MEARFAAAGIAAVILAGAVGVRAAAGEVHVYPDRNRDAYTLVVGEHSITTNMSIEEMKRIHEKFGGSVLWFRRHGKTYVVTDTAKLAQASALFDAMRELEPQQADLARRQRVVELKDHEANSEREELETRIESRDVDDRDSSWDQRLRELDEAEQRVEEEDRRLDAEDRELDRKSEELERAAETKLWALIDRWISSGEARRSSER